MYGVLSALDFDLFALLFHVHLFIYCPSLLMSSLESIPFFTLLPPFDCFLPPYESNDSMQPSQYFDQRSKILSTVTIIIPNKEIIINQRSIILPYYHIMHLYLFFNIIVYNEISFQLLIFKTISISNNFKTRFCVILLFFKYFFLHLLLEYILNLMSLVEMNIWSRSFLSM